MPQRVKVDSDAIHAFARHIRAAADAVAAAQLPEAPAASFESTVADEAMSATADLRRQLGAMHDLTSSLALAADRAADELVAADAGLADSMGQ